MTTQPDDARPWHQRIPWVGTLRQPVRTRFFQLLRQTFATDDGRSLLIDSLRGLLAWQASLPGAGDSSSPYPDLGGPGAPEQAYAQAVFITARFRSGSTLLWNIFRHVDGCTAFYEPLNERRWFDPATRGLRLDPTHRGVTDYWREYEGLSDLARWYREDWTRRNLHMDAAFWDPDLHSYVHRLVTSTGAARPVLQFNRIDFRLAWFRRSFPGARIVHLYRHPRDQWCSSLVDPARVPRQISLGEFAPHDHFYLAAWAGDLRHHFPFLTDDIHPYRAFYYIWKLSYLLGRGLADHSFSYEELLASPQDTIARLLNAVAIDSADPAVLARLVTPPDAGRWRAYAADDWYREHESACETVLRDFLRATPTLPPVAHRHM